MTGNELYYLANLLAVIKPKGPRMIYVVAKNKKSLDEQIKSMEKAIEKSERFNEYERKIRELKKQMSRKDAEGKSVMIPRIIEGQKVTVPDIPGMNNPDSLYGKEFSKLTKEYQADIDEYIQQKEKYLEFLKEEVDWDPAPRLRFEDLPDDVDSEAVYYLMDESTVPEEYKQKEGKKKPDKKTSKEESNK